MRQNARVTIAQDQFSPPLRGQESASSLENKASEANVLRNDTALASSLGDFDAYNLQGAHLGAGDTRD